MASRRPKSITIRSVMLKSDGILPLEIEIQLVPGIPTFQFFGLPEAGLKESSTRLRSAIQAAGFQWPQGKQVLVDVRPRLERKHGRGLDLPIALGYLILTGQVPKSVRDFLSKNGGIMYGDVLLDGSVQAPTDWERARTLVAGEILSGLGPVANEFRGGLAGEGFWTIEHLGLIREQGLDAGRFARLEARVEERDEVPDLLVDPMDYKVEERQARLALIAATGGHSLLLAGPQGTGKSTLARLVHRLAPALDKDERLAVQRWSGRDRRPLLEPHHTAGALAMIGGARPPRPGVITRAHCGTLLLDEVLLFPTDVQEALREPIETGRVQVVRGPDEREFPADFHLLGTTNLCACGRFTPIDPHACLCSSRKRVQFEERLRGPFVDRFQMLAFSAGWSPAKGKVDPRVLREQVALAREFARSQGRVGLNRRWQPHVLHKKEGQKSAINREVLRQLPQTGSERRRLSILRIARTIADLDGRETIETNDIFEAKEWALVPFQWLTPGADGFAGFTQAMADLLTRELVQGALQV